MHKSLGGSGFDENSSRSSGAFDHVSGAPLPPDRYGWIGRDPGADRAKPDHTDGCSGLGEANMPNTGLGSGVRKSAGKNRLDLLPWDAIEAVGRVNTFGAIKYSDRNWELGMRWGECFAALLRHAFKFWRGEKVDEETGECHMAHVVWNALVLWTYAANAKYAPLDDRPAIAAHREAEAIGRRAQIREAEARFKVQNPGGIFHGDKNPNGGSR